MIQLFFISVLIMIFLLIKFNENISGETLYKKLSSHEAKEIIDNEDVIILDVRTLEEYNHEYIKGAMLIPLSQLDRMADSKLENKNKKILIYCRIGNRSKTAANLLIGKGYSNIYDFGGILEWPYETIS